MRKRITVFVALMMVVCLALAGCGQNPDKQVENQTSESSVADNSSTENADKADGTASPGGIEQVDDDSYADDAAQDLNQDGAAEEAARNENDSSGGNTTSDGMYSWQVGNYTLTTRINVMDYIDGENWDVKAMSEALGYYPIEAFGMVDTRHYKNNNSPVSDINFNYTSNGNFYGYFYVMTYASKDSENILSFSVNSKHSITEYNFGSSDNKIPFELIVAYAFACEHLNIDSTVNPFYGTIPTDYNGNCMLN